MPEQEKKRAPLNISPWAREKIGQFRDKRWKIKDGSGRPPSLSHALDTIIEEWERMSRAKRS